MTLFVCQGPTEKEQIDVQGDISYDIVEFITDTWPDVTTLNLILSLTFHVSIRRSRYQSK